MEGLETRDKRTIPTPLGKNIIVALMLRNMNPVHHRERRNARIEALCKSYIRNPDTRYMDVAKYPRIPAHAVSVINRMGMERTAATTLTREVDTAEEVAIALAITTCKENAIALTPKCCAETTSKALSLRKLYASQKV